MLAFVAALVAQSPTNYPSGEEGLERLLSAFYLFFGVGFVLAVIGHMFKARTLVIAGIALVAIGTVLFFVAVGTYD